MLRSFWDVRTKPFLHSSLWQTLSQVYSACRVCHNKTLLLFLYDIFDWSINGMDIVRIKLRVDNF